MKKIYIILTMLFVSITSLFAGIDAQNIPEIVNGIDHAKFRLDRLETVVKVRDRYDIKIGASILDIDSSIFNNDYAVAATSINDSGNIEYSENDQSYIFPKKIFFGFSMNVNGIGFGFGYQFAYSTLTLDDLGLWGTQTFTDDNSNYGSTLTDRLITSHTFAFGLVALGGALEFNVPFSFTAANSEYYSTYITASETGERATPEGNVSFSMLPSFTYNTRGKAFTYITTTFGFGINKGTDIKNDYISGHAIGLSLEVEMGLNVMTDPINILIQPDIYASVGINSDSYAINALYTSAHKAQYSKGSTPVLAYVNLPVEFSSSIGNAIRIYGEPQLGFFYSQHGVSDIAISSVGDEAIYGLMYGMEAGVSFAPIENLTFAFDLHAIGGPNYTLQSSDYVYIVGADVVNGSSFTFGLNASLLWRF